MTIIRKQPEVSTADFRRFMEEDYGPVYGAMPEVREYVQYFLSDNPTDGAEDPVDAIVRIAFDSETEMRRALQGSDAYARAADARTAYMRETSAGIHSTRVDREVTFRSPRS